MAWKKHHVFRTKKRGLYWQFDTFRNAEGYDRLIMNSIRGIAILGSWFLLRSSTPFIIGIPLLSFCVFFAGVTKFNYFQKHKEFEIRFWA